MFNEFKDVLTVDEVCKALRIGKNSLYALLKSNEIRYKKVGKKYLIPKVCLIDYINNSRNEVV